MDAREEKLWRSILDNRHLSVSELAEINDVSAEEMQSLINRISSENWREEKPEVPVRNEILDTAKHYISVDRAATHGEAEDSFREIAGHWSWWLREKLAPGEVIDGYDVAQMMVGFKQARMKSNPAHLDSAQDMCGYGALAGEIGVRNGKRKMEKP